MLVCLEGTWNLDESTFSIQHVDLGEWERVPPGFTVGFFKDGAIYFSAAAERTDNTYDDGEGVGSVIGKLKKMKSRSFFHGLKS